MENIFKPDFKWRMIDRITPNKTKGKNIIVYQKGEPAHRKSQFSWNNWRGTENYKVHVKNLSGELWKEFSSVFDMKDFVAEAEKKIFWKGEFFDDRSQAWKKEPFTKTPWGKKPVPQEYKDAVIKYVIKDGHSTYQAVRKFKKHHGSIHMILKQAGYRFKRKNENSTLEGKWVKA